MIVSNITYFALFMVHLKSGIRLIINIESTFKGIRNGAVNAKNHKNAFYRKIRENSSYSQICTKGDCITFHNTYKGICDIIFFCSHCYTIKDGILVHATYILRLYFVLLQSKVLHILWRIHSQDCKEFFFWLFMWYT